MDAIVFFSLSLRLKAFPTCADTLSGANRVDGGVWLEGKSLIGFATRPADSLSIRD